jgi:hypothetical protein
MIFISRVSDREHRTAASAVKQKLSAPQYVAAALAAGYEVL